MIELTLIPKSGKPQDLNLEEIKTLALANVAEKWLDDMLENMRIQAEDEGNDGEPEQRGRLHGAIAKTATRLGLVREIQARMKMDWYEAFYLAFRKEYDEEELRYLEAKTNALLQ